MLQYYIHVGSTVRHTVRHSTIHARACTVSVRHACWSSSLPPWPWHLYQSCHLPSPEAVNRVTRPLHVYGEQQRPLVVPLDVQTGSCQGASLLCQQLAAGRPAVCRPRAPERSEPPSCRLAAVHLVPRNHVPDSSLRGTIFVNSAYFVDPDNQWLAACPRDARRLQALGLT